jgi:hypothetical protein
LAAAGLAEPATAFDPLAGPWLPVLDAAARAAPPQGARSMPAALRQRLLRRVGASAATSRNLHTRRHADTQPLQAAAGVTLRSLYTAQPGRPLRPGEPAAVTLVQLAPGASWSGPPASHQREWLVLSGSLHIGTAALQAHDYHVCPAGYEAGLRAGNGGALLYQRQCASAPAATGAASAASAPCTQHAAQAEWADFAPGITRAKPRCCTTRCPAPPCRTTATAAMKSA